MQAPEADPVARELIRLRLAVRGAVQGVGFRPFVYWLAEEMGLAGWVRNTPAGVVMEVEGARQDVEEFAVRLRAERPPRSAIHGIEIHHLDPQGGATFEIRESDGTGETRALVLPDIATCVDCLREIFDPSNRRYRYPFTNCTHCGPRFSIIEALPYDRTNTSMRHFAMCGQCEREYRDPCNRRFHAQPNACPDCGPQVALWDATGTVLSRGDKALLAAVEVIRSGGIVAVKGIGGFHLFTDARNDGPIRRLRERKHREEKPLAIMFPTLAEAKAACELSVIEERLLVSPEAPITIVRRRPGARVAALAAPGNPWIGALLPYAPIHHLLIAELKFAVVATSGNQSDEPICTDEKDALARLSGVADVFLVHDRPIVRAVDDSVIRSMSGREMMLRRARGYAPLPVGLPEIAPPALALGAQFKNSIALAVGAEAFVSQHIGDLSSPGALDALRRAASDLQQLFRVRPTQVVIDEHLDYTTQLVAHEFGAPVVSLQHHSAHVLSCMVENGIAAPVLGVAWDGAGYGTDGTIWGGEFLRITSAGFERVAHLRTFRLPGGDKAAREPRRSALGVLHEILGDSLFRRRSLATLRAFSASEIKPLRQMLARRLHCPITSSAGRLFDAVSSIVGLQQHSTFEGHAAMKLEFAADEVVSDEAYDFPLRADGVLDWEPAVRAILADLRSKRSAALVSAKFHNGLTESIVSVARRAGEPVIALTGGCFQNKYLAERAIRRLREEGFKPIWHQRVPPNDGGVALGQIAAWARASEPARPP